MKKPPSPLMQRTFGKGRKQGAYRAAVFASIVVPTLAIMFLSFFLLKDALSAREAARRQTTIERDRLFAHSIAHAISSYIEAARDAVLVAAEEAKNRPKTLEGMRALLTNTVD